MSARKRAGGEVVMARKESADRAAAEARGESEEGRERGVLV
jgi:hypothetical protein